MNTEFDWSKAGRGIVYVKPVDVEDLPREIREQAGAYETLFAVHDADGAQLALVVDRAMAFALAVQNDMRPVTLQ